MSKELIEKIQRIQTQLKAPKSQYNKFGQYAYRNQEDILEAVKPLLAVEKLVQTVSDEIIAVGGRIYVKATVTVTDGESFLVTTAFAREPEDQKGMSSSQITGSASSYARKYALNGMYAIDDTKDADATNDHGKTITKEDVKVSSGIVKANSAVVSVENAKEAPKAGRFTPKNKEKTSVTVDPTDSNSSDDGWN
jgi:hypothetical protein